MTGVQTCALPISYDRGTIVQQIKDNSYGFTYKNILNFKLIDVTPVYEIVTLDKVDEGAKLNFYVYTENVSDKTNLYWKIDGVSPSLNDIDFTNKKTTGTVTISNNGLSEIVSVDILSDQLTEGPEKFVIKLFSNPARTSDSFLIQDRKSTRLNSSHIPLSRMPSSA